MKTITTKNKLTHWLLAAFSICITLFTIGCSKDDNDIGEGTTDDELSITSIEPATARVYEEFTINGTGFSTEATANVVYFSSNLGDNDAQRPSPIYVSHTPTSITVQVPADLRYIQDGPITVQVNGESVKSEQDFTIDTSLGYPMLETITPTHAVPGAEVTITGDNFGGDNYNTGIEDLTVLFGDQEAKVISVGGNNARGNQIKVEVPNIPEGAVQISVQREDFVGQTTLDFTVDPLPASVKATYIVNEDGIVKGEVTESGLQFTTLYSATDNDDIVKRATHLEYDVTNGYLYWESQGEIYRATNDGMGTPESVFAPGVRFYSYDIDYTNNIIYYIEYTEEESIIKKQSLSGGTATELYSGFTRELSWVTFEYEGENPTNLVVDSEHQKLYWADLGVGDNVERGLKSGSTDGTATIKLELSEDEMGAIESAYCPALVFEPATNELFVLYQMGSVSNLYKTTIGTKTATKLVAGKPVDATTGENGLLFNPTGLEVDTETGFVYFMDLYDNKTDVINQTTYAIRRVPLNGGDVEVLFPDLLGSTFALEIN
ncbi:IPT/TIG domain-containing protein [Pseudotamlana agarivorans]|uniref:IPT/TIG domain-containing protein n=1 Tax=Pseudotamlana agarivorans TaxID=481183 RepID=UPI00083709CB|nr:IPT/TIG domain-containing protein [Tamlana agarivorans]